MKSLLRPANIVLAGLLVVLLLAACGDSAVTLGPSAPITTATTAASTTSAATTTAAVTTKAATTTAARQTGPSLEIVITKTTISVGEEITITGKVKQMGLAAYSLYVDGKFYANDHDAIDTKDITHPVVQFVSATQLNNQGVFVLQGIAAGKVKISMGANGEIAIVTNGQTAYNFTNVVSHTLEVTITGS